MVSVVPTTPGYWPEAVTTMSPLLSTLLCCSQSVSLVAAIGIYRPHVALDSVDDGQLLGRPDVTGDGDQRNCPAGGVAICKAVAPDSGLGHDALAWILSARLMIARDSDLCRLWSSLSGKATLSGMLASV